MAGKLRLPSTVAFWWETVNEHSLWRERSLRRRCFLPVLRAAYAAAAQKGAAQDEHH
jgi:hypothetical protein